MIKMVLKALSEFDESDYENSVITMLLTYNNNADICKDILVLIKIAFEDGFRKGTEHDSK
jgi:hypothetical protein